MPSSGSRALAGKTSCLIKPQHMLLHQLSRAPAKHTFNTRTIAAEDTVMRLPISVGDHSIVESLSHCKKTSDTVLLCYHQATEGALTTVFGHHGLIVCICVKIGVFAIHPRHNTADRACVRVVPINLARPSGIPTDRHGREVVELKGVPIGNFL